MGKLRVLSGAQVCDILRRHGFAAVRQRGSHIIMQRTTDDGTVTVSIPDHNELLAGTLRGIIRQSGVPRAEFETP